MSPFALKSPFESSPSPSSPRGEGVLDVQGAKIRRQLERRIGRIGQVVDQTILTSDLELSPGERQKKDQIEIVQRMSEDVQEGIAFIQKLPMQVRGYLELVDGMRQLRRPSAKYFEEAMQLIEEWDGAFARREVAKACAHLLDHAELPYGYVERIRQRVARMSLVVTQAVEAKLLLKEAQAGRVITKEEIMEIVSVRNSSCGFEAVCALIEISFLPGQYWSAEQRKRALENCKDDGAPGTRLFPGYTMEEFKQVIAILRRDGDDEEILAVMRGMDESQRYNAINYVVGDKTMSKEVRIQAYDIVCPGQESASQSVAPLLSLPLLVNRYVYGVELKGLPIPDYSWLADGIGGVNEAYDRPQIYIAYMRILAAQGRDTRKYIKKTHEDIQRGKNDYPKRRQYRLLAQHEIAVGVDARATIEAMRSVINFNVAHGEQSLEFSQFLLEMSPVYPDDGRLQEMLEQVRVELRKRQLHLMEESSQSDVAMMETIHSMIAVEVDLYQRLGRLQEAQV